jgi:N-acetylglucosaminyldiphosphoundecaprenol N-acetyl-beta-D-mannosaminyltransferase
VKASFGSIKVDNVTMEEAVEVIVRLCQKSELPRIVCTANLDHLAMAQCDPEFLAIYQDADFVVADGMPLIWLSRFTNCQLKERVAGSDLLWELGRASSATGIKLFFLGGQPGAAAKAAAALIEKYPGANVAGTYCPPYGTLDDQSELLKIRSEIAAAAPDVLLVGFGSPKQEKWISSYKDLLGVPVSIGVGGSFDMAAGVVKRAPIWMRSFGLEWVFRLCQEPRRLWHRYFGRDVPFFGWLFVSLLSERLSETFSPNRRRRHEP